MGYGRREKGESVACSGGDDGAMDRGTRQERRGD